MSVAQPLPAISDSVPSIDRIKSWTGTELRASLALSRENTPRGRAEAQMWEERRLDSMRDIQERSEVYGPSDPDDVALARSLFQ
jgi:hypothetical protein